MKMDKNKKQMLGLLVGAAVIGGVVWYIMKLRRDKTAQYRSKKKAQELLKEAQAPTVTFDNQIEIGKGLGEGKYKWYRIAKRDKAKADASLQIGTQGMVNGTEPCTISEFWMDSDGNKGSFRCEEKAEGTYDISEGSRFEY